MQLVCGRLADLAESFTELDVSALRLTDAAALALLPKVRSFVLSFLCLLPLFSPCSSCGHPPAGLFALCSIYPRLLLCVSCCHVAHPFASGESAWYSDRRAGYARFGQFADAAACGGMGQIL